MTEENKYDPAKEILKLLQKNPAELRRENLILKGIIV